MLSRFINRRRLFLFVIALVFITGLIALCWLFFRPAKIVRDSLADLGQSEGQRYTAAITIANAAATQELLGEQAQINLLIDGFYRRETEQPATVLANISFTTSTDSVSVQVDGEARLIGEHIYLLIRTAPPVFPYLAALKNQWLQLPRGGTAPGELPADQSYFTRVSRTGSDRLDGEKVKLYDAAATPEGILSFMDHLAAILGTRLTTDQIAAYRQGVANVDQLPVQLAVKPWSRDLRRLATTLQLPGYNGVNLSLDFKPLVAENQLNPPAEYLTLEEMAAAANSDPAE